MQAQKLTLFNFLILEKDFLQKSFITSTTDLLLTNNIVCVPKGSFRWAAFDACGCGRQLRFRRDRKFSIFLHRTLLPQPHESNAARLNEPLICFAHSFTPFVKDKEKEAQNGLIFTKQNSMYFLLKLVVLRIFNLWPIFLWEKSNFWADKNVCSKDLGKWLSSPSSGETSLCVEIHAKNY